MNSYTKAYEDLGFLNLPELRPVRSKLKAFAAYMERKVQNTNK